MALGVCVVGGLAFGACAADPAIQQRSVDEVAQEAHERKERNQEGRKAFIEAHPELSPELKQDIARGQIVPGMTKDMVVGIENGKPDPRCPSSTSSSGEAWDYCRFGEQLGPLTTLDTHKVITFDSAGKVVSVSSSTAQPAQSGR